MSAMKLQKLVYYAQAWSLVWDERPLFLERIEAWANGPVLPALYSQHKGKFLVGPSDISGNTGMLDAKEIETIDAVLKYYGGFTAQQLSDLTHSESPWKDARGSLIASERGQQEITHAAMAEYYGSL